MPVSIYDQYNEWKKRNKLHDDDYAPSMENKSEWISVPYPKMPTTDYDTEFLLTGATGGRVPKNIIDRYEQPFKKKNKEEQE